MKKILHLSASIFVIVFSLCTSIKSYGNIVKAKHYIVFVHGIGDGISRFKVTGKSLPRYLNKVDKKYTYKSLYYRYRTGVDVFDTYDFARGLGKFFERKFRDIKLGDQDRISLFSHSQGGLVSLIWLYDIYNNYGQYSGGAYLKHLYSFLTFGSPFLGTQIVKIPLRIGTDIFKLFRFPVGKRELQDMLYGSPMMDNIEKIILDNNNGFRDYLKQDLRFYNFVGNAGLYPTFSSSNYGLQDDTTVPVTSAHLNYIYIKQRTETQKFFSQKTYDGIPFEIINATHIGLPFMQGMVEFPLKCASLIPCRHPAFFQTTQILLGNEYLNSTELGYYKQKKLRSVVVHIKLFLDSKFPTDKDKLDEDDFLFRVFGNKGLKIKDKPFYFDVKDMPIDSRYKYRVDAYYSGKILSDNLEEISRSVLIIQNRRKGNLHKFFDLTVKRSYTTIIDSDFPSKL